MTACPPLFWIIFANAAAVLASGLHWKQLRIWPPCHLWPAKNPPQKISKLLSGWAGTRWVVTLSHEQGQPSLKEQEEKTHAAGKETLMQNALVQEVIGAFPGAEIIEFKPV